MRIPNFQEWTAEGEVKPLQRIDFRKDVTEHDYDHLLYEPGVPYTLENKTIETMDDILYDGAYDGRYDFTSYETSENASRSSYSGKRGSPKPAPPPPSPRRKTTRYASPVYDPVAAMMQEEAEQKKIRESVTGDLKLRNREIVKHELKPAHERTFKSHIPPSL